jgi:hypothetical protein
MPKKDEVQEEVSKMKNLQLKRLNDKDRTLNLPMWYGNRTMEAMFMHVMAILDAIKKHYHFKDYNKAQAAYVEQKEAVKLAKDSLSFLDRASKGSGKSRKTLKTAKEAKGKSKKANGTTEVPKNPMWVTFQANLEKAKKAAEDAKGTMTVAANQMFAFYANLLTFEVKYALNKISKEQMEATCMWMYKASLRKPQGEYPANCSTIACCFTFSPCFPSTRLSKKSTTSQMY